jgi:hypothetical protein
MTLNYFKNNKWQMSEVFNGTVAAAKKLAKYNADNSSYTVNVESDAGTVLFVAKAAL